VGEASPDRAQVLDQLEWLIIIELAVEPGEVECEPLKDISVVV
jgi:hypothetical protein